MINAMAVNKDGLMVTGGDDGSLWFWDWMTGQKVCFRQNFNLVPWIVKLTYMLPHLSSQVQDW